MWCKWRHKFSSGAEAWTWLYLGAGSKEAWEKTIRNEHCPEWEREYDWSEHYRGIDFEIVDAAPREVITRKLEECERRIKNDTQRAQEFRAQLKEMSDDTGENDRGI